MGLHGLNQLVTFYTPGIATHLNLVLTISKCYCRVIRALLNTGTEWNRTEYTGISRNIPEQGRMAPE